MVVVVVVVVAVDGNVALVLSRIFSLSHFLASLF